MAKYFIGIDNGGTAIKVAMFDESGKEIAVASRSTPVIVKQSGWAQRDMEEMWQINCGAIKEVVEKSGVAPADINGVGCTGHGKGLYVVGEGGKIIYDAIASTDNRAFDIVEKFKRSGVAEKLKKITLQPLLACQPAALLVWLKENEPEVYKSIRWVFEAKDYIRFRLTGEAYGEITDYSGTSLLNLNTSSYDSEILSLLGLESVEGCLPPIKYSHEECGVVSEAAAELTGLAAGTAVCGGMFDIDACGIGMGMISQDDLCVITGTWSINQYISRKPVVSNTTKNSLFCMKDYYLIEESSPTSAGNLEWLVDNFFEGESKKEIYRYIDSEVAKAEFSSLLFVPFLYGNYKEDSSLAGFYGLTTSTTKIDMARAVMEGVVFSHAYHIENLLKHRIKPISVKLSGGAARSEVWVQMFADILDVSVEIIDGDEIGALGCAITASIAGGVYADYSEAVRHMSHIRKVVTPSADGVYKAKLLEKYSKFIKFKNSIFDLED